MSDASEILARKLREAADEIANSSISDKVDDTRWTECANCGIEQYCLLDGVEWVCEDYKACRDRMRFDTTSARVTHPVTVDYDRAELSAQQQGPPNIDAWSKEGAEGALCHLCPLASQICVRTYIPPDLKPNERTTIFIGEAPGEQEAHQGIPFVGPSGKLLTAIVQRAGGDFSEHIRTNTVLCRPPDNRTPTDEEIACCQPRLTRELNELPFQRIVTLGKSATITTRRLIGKPQLKRDAERGVWTRWDATGKYLLPTWHPAFILRKHTMFPELLRDITKAIAGPKSDPISEQLATEPEVTVITSRRQLVQVLDSIATGSWVAFDLETDQLCWYDRPAVKADPILCMAFTTGVGYGWIIPDYLLYDCPGVPEIISNFFKRIRTIAHNGKFDVLFSKFIGIEVHLDHEVGAFDTMIAHYGLDENPGTHGLKELAQETFGIVNYEEMLIKEYLTSKNDRYSKIPEDKLYLYAVWDVCATIALAPKFKAELIRQNMLEKPFQSLYMPAIKTLARMEWRGILIDVDHLNYWRGFILKRADMLAEQMRELAGDPKFNPGSVVQLKKLLYGKLNLPIPHAARSGTGVLSKEGATSKVALKQIAGLHPILDILGEWRTARKIVSSYIDNLLNLADVNGRVHTQYFFHGTETGRMSARNPALQTIPRGSNIYGQIIKSAFIASPGRVFVDCDYKSAELRVFAAESREPFLIQVYEDERDLHTEVTVAMYGLESSMSTYEWKERRNICKMFNFAWVYGGGEGSFGDIMPNHAQAVKFVQDYESNMPVAVAWKAHQFELAMEYGYVLSRTGRKRRFPFITADNAEDVRKAAINAPIQGGASDCTTLSGIRLDQEYNLDVLLFVHDSIITEVDEDKVGTVEPLIERVMVETAAELYPEVRWAADPEHKRRWVDPPTEAQIQQWFGSIIADSEV